MAVNYKGGKCEECHDMYNVTVIKKAALLHKEINQHIPRRIMMRVCSENIGLIKNKLHNKE